MAERQKISLAALIETLEAVFSRSLGHAAAQYMPRIALCAMDGEPNWGARIGEVPLSVLSAYNETIADLRARYDLDEVSIARLRPVEAAAAAQERREAGERRKITFDEVKNILIDQTTDALRRDARFIAPNVVFRKRDGTPNWDANINIQAPTVVKAFGFALARTQESFDIEW